MCLLFARFPRRCSNVHLKWRCDPRPPRAGFLLLVALATAIAGGGVHIATPAQQLTRSGASGRPGKRSVDVASSRLTLRGGGIPLVPMAVAAGVGVTLKVNEGLRERVMNAFKHISFGQDSRRSSPRAPSLLPISLGPTNHSSWPGRPRSRTHTHSKQQIGEMPRNGCSRCNLTALTATHRHPCTAGCTALSMPNHNRHSPRPPAPCF